MEKLKSRKFWMAIASVLGSIAAAIAGYASENETVMIIGIICGVVSAAIYEIAEALVDCERATEETSQEIDTMTVKYKDTEADI